MFNNARISRSYPESHSKNFFSVSWSTQDGHTNHILPEVYGAISILDRVKDTAINKFKCVNKQIIMTESISLCMLLHAFHWCVGCVFLPMLLLNWSFTFLSISGRSCSVYTKINITNCKHELLSLCQTVKTAPRVLG